MHDPNDWMVWSEIDRRTVEKPLTTIDAALEKG